MGRTITPVRYEIRARLDELERFVASLRDYDRNDFSMLEAAVHKRIGAMSYSQPLDPTGLMQWCAIIELYSLVRRMRNDLDRRDLV